MILRKKDGEDVYDVKNDETKTLTGSIGGTEIVMSQVPITYQDYNILSDDLSHVEGVMEGNLPWALVFIGVFIAIVVELVGLPVLPFAIGIYLPVQLNACIMVGGLV